MSSHQPNHNCWLGIYELDFFSPQFKVTPVKFDNLQQMLMMHVVSGNTGDLARQKQGLHTTCK